MLKITLKYFYFLFFNICFLSLKSWHIYIFWSDMCDLPLTFMTQSLYIYKDFFAIVASHFKHFFRHLKNKKSNKAWLSVVCHTEIKGSVQTCICYKCYTQTPPPHSSFNLINLLSLQFLPWCNPSKLSSSVNKKMTKTEWPVQ